VGAYNELPVYKATYDLLLGIFQFTKGFSKEYKYMVGESLNFKMGFPTPTRIKE
jgi:hypothetical protein